MLQQQHVTTDSTDVTHNKVELTTMMRRSYRVAQKIGTLLLYALTLPNINRFSILFHCQNQAKTCNNAIAKDPITSQVCRYTTV